VEKIEITVERQRPSGSLLLSTIHKGQYVKHVYMGYSERDAKKEFRKLVREQTA